MPHQSCRAVQPPVCLFIYFLYSFNSREHTNYFLGHGFFPPTSLWPQNSCAPLSCVNPIAFYFDSIQLPAHFFNLSWGFGNFCLSRVDTCHCWYLTDRELGWRETLPQTQCEWSGLYFLNELMVLIEMTCKVISVLFCNVTTSAAGSQDGQAAQEITLMD